MTSNALVRDRRIMGLKIPMSSLVLILNGGHEINQNWEGYPPLREWEYVYSFFKPEEDSVFMIFRHDNFPLLLPGVGVSYISCHVRVTIRWKAEDDT